MHNRTTNWGNGQKLITHQVLRCSDYGNSNYEQEKQFKRSQGISADE
jgi:hypothetical protein